jgi:hypothetical protein
MFPVTHIIGVGFKKQGIWTENRGILTSSDDVLIGNTKFIIKLYFTAKNDVLNFLSVGIFKMGGIRSHGRRS